MKFHDLPHPKATKSQDVYINPDQLKEIRKRINKSRLRYMDDRGTPYSIKSYNCATWAANILSDLIGTADADKVRTPRQLRQLLDGSQ